MIEYGLSIDTVPPEKLPAGLTWLMLDNSVFTAPLRWPDQHRKMRRAVAHLADRSLCRLAPAENLRLRLDFLRMMDRQLTEAARTPVEMVRIDCDFGRAGCEPAYREQLLVLLRAIGGMLEPHDMQLELGGRMPDEGCRPEQILALLRELPNRKIKLQWEIHPHEPGAAAIPAPVCRLLGYEAETLEFVYEPALGNHLTPKLLLPVLRALPEIPGRRIFFRPVGLSANAVAAEAAELAALAATLQTELNSAAE